MTFLDLPPGWPARSLRDLRLAADVVDLVVRDSDRASGCLALLLCDDDGRMIEPVTVADVPLGAAADERDAFFDAFLGHLGRSLGSVVFVVGRPGGLALTDDTRDWHESAVQAARGEGVELIATYLATGEGVVLLPTLTEQGLAS